MNASEHTVRVGLAERSYDIVIGDGLLPSIGSRCRDLFSGRKTLVVSDGHVAPLYAETVCASLREAGFAVSVAVVPAGEGSKSAAQLTALWSAAVEAGVDRKSFLVALGGGVVGDLGGFAAASFLRGIPFVQVPTSLLAMVDSAVGGKTGINLPQGKNLVGAFHQPALVLADLDVLSTLPPREFSAGMAEVIKYGVIYDPTLFDRIEANVAAIRALDRGLLAELVRRSCEIKAEVVGIDEREDGLRAILNYGHTLGHAIENVQGYGQLLHGEAIAIGMVFASRVSECECGLPPDATARQAKLFQAFGLPTDWSAFDWSALRRAMAVDKKAANASPRFVLAESLGKVGLPRPVSDEVLSGVFRKGCGDASA